MKTYISTLIALLVSIMGSAQTMNINMGNVTYAIPAEQAGEMIFSDATSLTIGQKTYRLADITNITTDGSTVSDNAVDVTYDGNTAKVRIAGNIAPHITATVNGAHVTVIANEALANEVTYTLSGSSSNGSFYMDGSYKMTLKLNGLTLVNPDSAAVNIQNGKLISVVLVNGTTNSLTDGLTSVADDDSDGHKAALYFDGHSEWSGSGSLTLTGKVKHAYSSDEYTLFGSGLGNVTVNSAVSDGLHINQYFQMLGGNVNITSTGDGIDVGAKKTEKELNGQLIISGGILKINTSGLATKGLKCDNNMTINGGTVTVTTTGSAYYDTSEADITSSAGAKCDGTFTMSGGTLSLTSTGAGGKGVNATGAVTFSGGTTTVVTTGAVYTYGADDTKPQGVKSDTNITLSGGTILVCASSDSGTAFKTDYSVLTNGATVMGVGGKATTPGAASTCNYKKYTGVKVTGGSTLSYNGVSFTIPAIYSNSSAKVLVSSASM
ncbi:MAG: carbohydrate-binding domain-containing protein [Prevotella sp.]|nr:carbohydrate-binding domain-containing protein [Prevotella sp.]